MQPNKIFIFLALFFPTISCVAFHIVGGEVSYKCLGNNQYQISLTVYRDCNSTGAPLDNPAYIFVFDSNNEVVKTLSVPLPGVQEVPFPESVCIETLPDICVEKTTYVTNVTLPDFGGEYTIVYQRYSRNSTIDNLVSPDQTGSTYSTNIPSVNWAVCNSSPVFNNFPPTVICANYPLSFDHSASDPDGDSLVYELCDPLIGGSELCPQPGSANCTGNNSPDAPPFPVVTWQNPYSATNPLGNNALQINPQTGLLTGVPPTLGQFVVGICVSEYRNGVYLNTVRRDFQFNVTDCVSVTAAVKSDEIDANGSYIITDCGLDFSVSFINKSLGATSYYWDFGDPTTTTDHATLENPSYLYPDTGLYVVKLIATSDNQQCADTANIIVKLYPTLTSNFTFVSGCANIPVVFTDASVSTYGSITSWLWEFDDGSTSTEQNPSHLFNEGDTYSVSLTTTTSLGCVNTISKNVVVKPMPIANFTISQKCLGIPIEFKDASTGANTTSWQWNFGDPNSGAANTASTKNATHSYQNTGGYTVTLIVSSNNGCTASKTKTFTIYPEFEATAFTSDPNICANETTLLEASGGGNNYKYVWTPATGLSDDSIANPTANPTQTTVYTVMILDPNACFNTDTVKINVSPLPTVNLSPIDSMCLGSNYTLMPQLSNNIVSMQWSDGNGIFSNTANAIVSPSQNTVYFFTALDDMGCSNQDSIQIIVIEPANTQALGTAQICLGQSTLLTATGGYTYVWTPADGLDNPNIANPIASPTQTTTYYLTAYNSCFTDKDSLTITVNPLPIINAGNDVTINVGEKIILQGTSDGNISWTPTSSLSNPISPMPEANPIISTTYVATATNEFGCINIDSVKVNVTNIFNVLIPNAFSPNNDGVNDEFKILAYKGLKSLNYFKIYNRWGNLVFESKDFNTGWDGFFKNTIQEIGVYIYVIEGNTYTNAKYIAKGNFTLIR